ncbi:MAG: CAF17-like 4Fe-4S cluster assembly/insertion protein YgfZ [Canibacter sp.]
MAEEFGVADHYGEPLREQRALENGKAIVDLSYFDVLTVTGADRLSWIDSMTSQLVRDLKPGQAAETLLLTPQGRVQQVIDLVDDGETLWLMTENSDELYTYLNRMRFALRVELQRVELKIYGAVGGTARERLLALPGTAFVWDDPWHEMQAGGFQYATSDEHPAHEYHMTRVAFESKPDLSGFEFAGISAVRALEVRAWRPTIQDVDERSLPHEFDWIRSSVHLTKGCYRGQETIAKVHNLGRPPRRLAMLHLDGSAGELPADGSLVYLGEKAVGRVTRAAQHHEEGPIALVLLKRATPADVELDVHSGDVVIAGTQEVIVPPDAGSSRSIPKLRRL